MCVHDEAFSNENLVHDFVKCERPECKTEEDHCTELYCGGPLDHIVHGGKSNAGRACKNCSEKFVIRK